MRQSPQSIAGAAAAAFAAACSLPVVGSLLSGFVPAGIPRWPAEPVARLSPPTRNGFAARGESTINYAAALALASLAGGVALAVRRQHRTTRKCSEEAAAAEWTGAAGFSSLTKGVPKITDNVDIRKILPHRYPFLLVDKIIEFEPGKRAVGVKNITANEPQFTGHFPDLPIMPGVLMVEAMAQLGGIVALQPPVSDGKGQFFFAGIDGVKFRKPVVPGDTLVMEMELTKFREKFGIAKFTGKAYTDGDLAVEVKDFTFALVKEQ